MGKSGIRLLIKCQIRVTTGLSADFIRESIKSGDKKNWRSSFDIDFEKLFIENNLWILKYYR